MQHWWEEETTARQVYLIDWERIGIPGIDSGLIDIHNSNFDTGTHLCNNTTGRPTDITSTDAANLLNFKHDCSRKRRGEKENQELKMKTLASSSRK